MTDKQSKEKALQSLHDENEKLGLYDDAYKGITLEYKLFTSDDGKALIQTTTPFVDVEVCQKILGIVEENAGLTHHAWDMLDPLELIALIVYTADRLKKDDLT